MTRKILVPVDLSETSIQVIQLALTLSSTMDAHLELLHVTDQPAGGHSNPEALRFGLEDLERWVMAVLRKLEAVVPDSLVLSCRTRQGDAGREIVQHANGDGIDLIVMAASNPNPARPLSEVAEHVLRLAPCPVITVRPVVTPGERRPHSLGANYRAPLRTSPQAPQRRTPPSPAPQHLEPGSYRKIEW